MLNPNPNYLEPTTSSKFKVIDPSSQQQEQIKTFDFTVVKDALGGMDITFKNYEAREDQLKKKLYQEHQTFYNKTITDKRNFEVKIGSIKKIDYMRQVENKIDGTKKDLDDNQRFGIEFPEADQAQRQQDLDEQVVDVIAPESGQKKKSTQGAYKAKGSQITQIQNFQKQLRTLNKMQDKLNVKDQKELGMPVVSIKSQKVYDDFFMQYQQLEGSPQLVKTGLTKQQEIIKKTQFDLANQISINLRNIKNELQRLDNQTGFLKDEKMIDQLSNENLIKKRAKISWQNLSKLSRESEKASQENDILDRTLSKSSVKPTVDKKLGESHCGNIEHTRKSILKDKTKKFTESWNKFVKIEVQATSESISDMISESKSNEDAYDLSHMMTGEMMKNMSPDLLLEHLKFQKEALPMEELEHLSFTQWIYLLKFSNLYFCPYSMLIKKLKELDIMNAVAIYILEKYGAKQKFQRQELEDALLQADRDLFRKFRDGQITFHQLRARSAEKNQNFKYQVLDDVIDTLHPVIIDNIEEQKRVYKLKFGKQEASSKVYSSFTKYQKPKKKDDSNKMPDVSVDRLLQSSHPSELNKRCLRSIKHNPKSTDNLIDGKFTKEEQKLKFLQAQNKDILERDQLFEKPENSNDMPKKNQTKVKKNFKQIKTKAEFISVKTQMQKKYEQSTKLLHKAHTNFVRSQSAFISSKHVPRKEYDDQNSNGSNRSVTARMNISSMQFGKKSEFVNIQKEQNEEIDLKEESNYKDLIEQRENNGKARLFPQNGLLKKIESQKMYGSRGVDKYKENKMTLNELGIHKIRQQRLPFFFMKQLAEDGKDIIISQPHQKKLDVIDTIAEAMEKDFKECQDLEDEAEAMEIEALMDQAKDQEKTKERVTTKTGPTILTIDTIVNTTQPTQVDYGSMATEVDDNKAKQYKAKQQNQQQIQRQKDHMLNVLIKQKQKALAKKSYDMNRKSINYAQQSKEKLETFCTKMRRMGSVSVTAQRQKTMREIARKKAQIERDLPERVIGIVGKCPYLAAIPRNRSTETSIQEEYKIRDEANSIIKQSQQVLNTDQKLLEPPNAVLKVTLEKINEDGDIKLESAQQSGSREQENEGSDGKTVTGGNQTNQLSVLSRGPSKIELRDDSKTQSIMNSPFLQKKKSNDMNTTQLLNANSPIRGAIQNRHYSKKKSKLSSDQSLNFTSRKTTDLRNQGLSVDLLHTILESSKQNVGISPRSLQSSFANLEGLNMDAKRQSDLEEVRGLFNLDQRLDFKNQSQNLLSKDNTLATEVLHTEFSKRDSTFHVNPEFGKINVLTQYSINPYENSLKKEKPREQSPVKLQENQSFDKIFVTQRAINKARILKEKFQAAKVKSKLQMSYYPQPLPKTAQGSKRSKSLARIRPTSNFHKSKIQVPQSIAMHHRYSSLDKSKNQTQRNIQSKEITADPYQQSHYSGFNNYPSLSSSIMKIQNNNLSARLLSHERSQTAEGLQKRDTIKIFMGNSQTQNNQTLRQTTHETQPLYSTASINAKTDRIENNSKSQVNQQQINLNSPVTALRRDLSASLWQDQAGWLPPRDSDLGVGQKKRSVFQSQGQLQNYGLKIQASGSGSQNIAFRATNKPFSLKVSVRK